MPTKPVWVLAGRDEYLRGQHRREIISRVGAGTEPAVAEFDGSAELSDVLDELRTLPLLAPRCVVIVREADCFVRAHARPLAGYLEHPSATATLVLMVDAWPPKSSGKPSGPEGQAGELPQDPAARPAEPSKKELEVQLAALDRLVGKAGEVLDCAGIPPAELPNWIAQAAKARGKGVARQAVGALIESVGNNLSVLDSELEKLAVYVGAEEEITAADVEAVVHQVAGPNAFALSKAIADGQTAEALNLLDRLLVRRGDEFPLLGLIAARLRWRLSGTERGPTRRLSPRRTGQDFRRMLRADLAMKSGADAKATMQWLVVALCQ